MKNRALAAVPATETLLPLGCDRCGARTDLTQTCAPCGKALCSDCYSPWTALACDRCRSGSDRLVVPAA